MNRTTLLAEFDHAKTLNSSRPVKTEHGNTGEASIRKWLSEFLPEKYGVTSGYIIPDFIVEKEGHYKMMTKFLDKYSKKYPLKRK